MSASLHDHDAGQTPSTTNTAARRGTTDHRPSRGFEPPKRRWLGLAATAVVAVGLAAVGISSWNSRVEVDRAASAGSSTAGSVGASGTSGNASASADDAIAAQVMKQIAADPALAALSIELQAEQGLVTLAGDVPDESTRARLAAIAAMQSGVRGVNNRLEIVKP